MPLLLLAVSHNKILTYLPYVSYSMEDPTTMDHLPPRTSRVIYNKIPWSERVRVL